MMTMENRRFGLVLIVAVSGAIAAVGLSHFPALVVVAWWAVLYLSCRYLAPASRRPLAPVLAAVGAEVAWQAYAALHGTQTVWHILAGSLLVAGWCWFAVAPGWRPAAALLMIELALLAWLAVMLFLWGPQSVPGAQDGWSAAFKILAPLIAARGTAMGLLAIRVRNTTPRPQRRTPVTVFD